MRTIIIVEGKSDTNRLKSIFPHIETYETSGLGLDEKKINYLKSIQDNTKLVIFTDPDGPGEIIRNRLIKELKNPYHAYLSNEKAINKKMDKIGIEHASEIDIKKALDNLYSIENNKMEYELKDLIHIGVYNNKERRLLFCNFLNIAYGNNKKVLKQLNNFSISKKKIYEFKEIHGTS